MVNNAKPFDKQYLDESIPPNILKTIQNIDAIGTAGVLVGNVHAGIVNNVMAGLSYTTGMVGEGLNPMKAFGKGTIKGAREALFNKDNILKRSFSKTL